MFLLDENTHGAIPNAIRQFNRGRTTQVDVLRVGEPGAPPLGTLDDQLLKWAEDNGRILVTEDVTTMPGHLAAHLAASRHSPGVLFVRPGTSIRQLYDELVLIAEVGIPDDFADRCHFIPM